MPKFRTLLKNKSFVLYSVGQAFSQFGDRLVQIVLIGFVYKRWPGSTFQLAKLFLFTIVPSFFASPIAGVYVDRWNKKYVMIISDIFRATAILLIPIFFIQKDSVIPIYTAIFSIFIAACFFLPARFSIIPSLVPKEDILIANSASSIIWIISGLAGFSIGGFLAEWAGVKNSLYINSLVYLFSALSFLGLAVSAKDKGRLLDEDTNRPSIKNVIKKSFVYDLQEGLKALFFEKNIRLVGGVFFIFSSVLGAIYVVGIVFIQETLQSMTRYISIFSICLFGGLLLGSYAYGKKGHKFSRAKVVFVSLIFVGIFMDIFALGLREFRSLWAGGVSSFFCGFFVAPIYVIANTVVHESVKNYLGGRVFSSLGIVINLGFLIFMLISSIVAEHIDRFWIFLACGSFIAALGMVNAMTGFLKRVISLSS
ncbi:MAG: MFS transporter [Candidatus Omnitrophica bacterium]|nr:MFS transporter [Candidatus Omnitrophota bacterium]